MRTEPRKDNDQPLETTQLNGGDRDPRPLTSSPVGQVHSYKFSPGDLLAERFLIIRFLGRGGMGEVYEAEDRLLKGTPVALKTIRPELSATPGAHERFEGEVLLARQVRHPNVCPIYDICYHEDPQGRCCFLSMKLLRGETLAARLDREGRLAEDEALPVIRQLAAALHAAHRERIIHRDIKPANVMLEGSGPDVKAVVTDFGLARKYDNNTTVSSSVECVGTPGYLAPELLRGQPATAASDLYAFGMVLHQIFGGEKPAGGDAHYGARSNQEFRSQDVPPFLASLIEQCLGDDPQKRYRAFERALSVLEVDSRDRPSAHGSRRFLSRRQLLGAAAASGGCALVGSAVWKWDEITTSLLHPLPRKRFVALVNWPPTSDRQIAPVLSGVIEAIERELSRAEAFDHDLLVISAPVSNGPAQLSQIRDSLGANLVLASSAVSRAKHVQLSLKVLDTAVDRVLRQKLVTCGLNDLTLLSEKAVHAAAQLLGVSQYVDDNGRLKAGTQSAEAYQAFQAAEALRRQPNDTGLEAAIEQYKAAVELDDHYGLAHARLAMAYCRQYGLRREPAALELAQANASTALELDKTMAEGHLALGWVLENRGQEEAALAEMGKALAIDPSNPRILIWEAQVYSRLNQLTQAEELFRRVLKARPNHWLAYNELGEVLNKDGRYREALQAYRTASLAQPKNALPVNNVGSIFLKLGQLKEAKESFQKSLALNPIAWAAANMAEALRAEGNYSEAVRFALKAVELDPSDEQNWLELGDCYSSLPVHRRQAQKAYSRAAEESEHHLQMDESDGPSWMLLALAQVKTGKPDAARATATKAEKLGATELDSQISKARILELTKQREEALATVAACFRKGATKFQIASLPDLQSLRADPRYPAISNSERVASNAAHN